MDLLKKSVAFIKSKNIRFRKIFKTRCGLMEIMNFLCLHRLYYISTHLNDLNLDHFYLKHFFLVLTQELTVVPVKYTLAHKKDFFK